MKGRWLLFTLEYLTSLQGNFIIKMSDLSTRKQLERQSLTQQIAVIKTLIESWSEHVLINSVMAVSNPLHRKLNESRTKDA